MSILPPMELTSSTVSTAQPRRSSSVDRPRRRAHNVATTERMLAAAEEEFAQHGFEAARLSDIAVRVGLARSSILHYFETKHALYAAVIRTAFLRLGEALALDLDGRDPLDARVVRAAEGLVLFLEARPSLAKIILREVLDEQGPGHEVVAEAGAVLIGQVERLIRESRARGGRVDTAVPLRGALLQIGLSVLVRASSGGRLREAMGDGVDTTVAMTRALLGMSTLTVLE